MEFDPDFKLSFIILLKNLFADISNIKQTSLKRAWKRTVELLRRVTKKLMLHSTCTSNCEFYLQLYSNQR